MLVCEIKLKVYLRLPCECVTGVLCQRTIDGFDNSTASATDEGLQRVSTLPHLTKTTDGVGHKQRDLSYILLRPRVTSGQTITQQEDDSIEQ